MADLFVGIVKYLLTKAPITALAGNRIQPIPAPEDLSLYPCVTVQIASDVSRYGFDGPDGVTTTRVVFDCFADRYLNARSLALAIKAALTGYSGTLPDGTQVFETQIVNIQDGFDDGSHISRTAVHALITYADL